MDVMNVIEEANKLKEPFRALMDFLLIKQATPIPPYCTARDYLQATVYVLEAKFDEDTRKTDALLPTLKGLFPRQVVSLPGPPLEPMGGWSMAHRF
ncbi:uncharacterized protein EAE97_004475 [Botrytis byssoidea]|uniref:Uncharacterized protein n=1 Tax=Botrytis byssoidea TaxID=139641 RepID=A0A9P5IMR4_9HELO|nr:uncharacterized protein EAE97_004475 [Botrytis byssoidea]KAF7947226.1 hypothetical protein EAE97_004475 [Botrytis byssoidea]